jgi:hypothetical protein
MILTRKPSNISLSIVISVKNIISPQVASALFCGIILSSTIALLSILYILVVVPSYI